MTTLPGEAALRDARAACFWLDRPDAPESASPLRDATTADLAVVGAGFTGLWTALLAKERDPSADVVLLEGRTAGWAASGRNGGFCAATLTHGERNGKRHFPDELDELRALGRANLDEMAADRALGLMSRSQMIAATQRGNARLGAIAAQLAEAASESVLAPFAATDNARAVWDGLDLPRQRRVLAALATVTLHPAGQGTRTFNPDTVHITPIGTI